MARTVRDIMNRELLTLRPDLPAAEARALLRHFQITAAPVVDDARQPLGVLSLSDPVELGGTVRDRMTRPAEAISVSATVDQVAARLANVDFHHLVVVDGAGKAVGMVSTIDALRAVLDLPTRHPGAFPHWDESTEVAWTDDWSLDERAAGRAPAGAGVIVLTSSPRGEAESVLWAESCPDVRARVADLAAKLAPRESPLARLLESPGLRFRAAAVPKDDERARILAILQDRTTHMPPPGGT